MNDFQDARGARRRLAWVHASIAEDIAKTLEADPDATINIDIGMAAVAAWEAFCKADHRYRTLKNNPLYVPLAEHAGDVLTPEQREAVRAYIKAHPEWVPAGTLLTRELANEAIDWFNNTGGRSD